MIRLLVALCLLLSPAWCARKGATADRINVASGGDPVARPSTAYTFAFWYRNDNAPAATDDYAVDFSSNGGANGDFGFAWSSSNVAYRPSCFHRDSADSYGAKAKPAASLLADTWYHIVCRWDGSTIKMYVNGAEDGSEAVTTIKDVANTWVLSLFDKYQIQQNPDDGQIAEFGYWNSSLSTTTISALARGAPPRLFGAKEYLPLEGFTSPERTQATSGHTGTLVNTTQTAHPPKALHSWGAIAGPQ